MIRMIGDIFEKRQKIKMIRLSILMVVNSLLELLGVSAIIPFMTLIAYPDEVEKNVFFVLIYRLIGVYDRNILIVFIAITISFIYLAKNVVYMYILNQQYKFTYYGQRDLAERIMKCYLYQDYSFHKSHNSAGLMRDITADTNMFYTTMLNILQLFAELCTSVLLIGFLAIQDITITLGVAVCLSFMLFFMGGSYKKTLIRLGDIRRYTGAKINQVMIQSFGGIKEIKISNKEDFFLEQFQKVNQESAEANRKNLFLNSLPKSIMEVLCIVGLMSVIAFQFYFNRYSEHFLSTLAVFAVAAFKLLPSINKVSAYIGNIFHNGVAIKSVYEILNKVKDLEKIENGCVNAFNMFRFNDEIFLCNVSFRYDDNELWILKDVNLRITKNQSVAFIGASGAGKTTLVDLILGVLDPNNGKILVDGIDIRDMMIQWHEKIGYIPQTIYMLDDTIRNNIAFGLPEDQIDEENIWEALREAQLEELVENMEYGLDTMIGESGVRLSGGQRQRLGIARALYRKPELIVLDEATSALDQDTEEAVMQSIDHLQGKITMLIIAHRLSTIKNCDVKYEVKNGSIQKVNLDAVRKNGKK